MTPTTNRLYFLIAAMRRYFATGRPRGHLYGARKRLKMAGVSERPAVDRSVGASHQLAKHGPIQITTVVGEPMATQDGVSVRITAKLAWSKTLPSAVCAPQTAGHLSYDRSPGRQDEVWAQALTRDALRTLLPHCGLAALLCERGGVEERVRLAIAPACGASGLIVHLVRIRAVDIPTSAQSSDDTKFLSALRSCIERRRKCGRETRQQPGAAAIERLIC